MNSINTDKKENEEEVLNKNNDKAFYTLLKGILNVSNITKDNFKEEIINYINSKELASLEKKLFELLLYLNPDKKKFNLQYNKEFLYQIMNLLLIKKGNKNIIRQIKDSEEKKIIANEINKNKEVLDDNKNENLNKIEGINNEPINSDEIMQACKKVFEEDELLSILFEGDINISNKEQYLEMIILFLPDREIQQILKVIKKYLKDENNKEIYESLEKIFTKINLKTENGFRFLREALIKFIEDKKDCIKSIKMLESKFTMEENKDLRCPNCFHLPSFSINDDAVINIRYKCCNIEVEENSNIQKIKDFKFKCKCNKLIIECNKNFLCSNCKKIVCTLCSKEHFEKCASIFFIPINDIDNICFDHNEKYEYYCGICEINLCEQCKKEHYHYVEKEEDINLDNDNLNNLKDIIDNNNKNDKNIISALKNIIKENKYRRNFRFIHFLRTILGNDRYKTKSKLFDELFGKEFNEYFKYMKNQIELGNYYYLNILGKFINYYKDKTINNNYLTFLTLNSIQYSKYHLDTVNNNFFKLSLVSRYFQTISDIKEQKQILNNIIEIKNNIINSEETKILTKSISYTSNSYRNILLKLIDRSIIESFIVYLIGKYSDNFNMTVLDSNIFTDLENYCKNGKKNINIIKEKIKDKIQKFLEKNNDNNNENKEMIFKKVFIDDDDLNKMLEFLFYIKNLGNFPEHSNSNNIIMSPNNFPSKINYINEVTEKFMSEQSFQNNEEINKILENVLNESLLENKDIQKMENIFENYIAKIKTLQDISEDLNEYNNFKEVENIQKSKPLKEFLERLDQLLKNEEKILSFLYGLNKSKYETSITGEKYTFFSYCLDYIISKIASKLNETIDDYKKEKDIFEKLIQSKEKIISFLTNLNKNIDDLKKYNEPIIDEDKIKLI